MSVGHEILILHSVKKDFLLILKPLNSLNPLKAIEVCFKLIEKKNNNNRYLISF